MEWQLILVFDGHEALARVGLSDYDVVVLDRDLPGVHGDDVCRSLAVSGFQGGVLMLTAAGGSWATSVASALATMVT